MQNSVQLKPVSELQSCCSAVCAVLKPFLLPLAVVCVSELGELIAHLCRESRDQQGQLYMYKTDRTIEIK